MRNLSNSTICNTSHCVTSIYIPLQLLLKEYIKSTNLEEINLANFSHMIRIIDLYKTAANRKKPIFISERMSLNIVTIEHVLNSIYI